MLGCSLLFQDKNRFLLENERQFISSSTYFSNNTLHRRKSSHRLKSITIPTQVILRNENYIFEKYANERILMAFDLSLFLNVVNNIIWSIG